MMSLATRKIPSLEILRVVENEAGVCAWPTASGYRASRYPTLTLTQTLTQTLTLTLILTQTLTLILTLTQTLTLTLTLILTLILTQTV
jgi:hypothetical protein